MKIIDTHLHLFDLESGDYQWLKETSPPFWPDKNRINSDFSDKDLVLNPANQLMGFVHVEAGFDNEQPQREIQWLEQSVSGPFKSIAHINLELSSQQIMTDIKTLNSYNSVVGVRHIFDERAHELLSNEQVVNNLAQIAKSRLLFETQLSGDDEQAISALVSVAQQLPSLTIILSHGCFFPVGKETSWQTNIERLALCPNIMIKASGWEMVSRDYQQATVKHVVNLLLIAFGVERVMFGSNFPLCLFSRSYDECWREYQALGIGTTALDALSYANAQRVYRFT